jgi:hypothetical protein
MVNKLKYAWCHRHLVLGWTWILLVVPGVLWWKESVLFVILLSLYANAESSFAAHHAKMGEQRRKEENDDDFDPCEPT